MRDKMLTQSLLDDPERLARSCRKRAETMHAIAATVRTPGVAAELNRQADEWEKMARDAERRIQRSAQAAH